MKIKILLTALLYSLIGLSMFFQLGVYNALAVEGENPITAAITGAITNPVPVSAPVPNAPVVTSPVTPAPVTGPVESTTPAPSNVTTVTSASGSVLAPIDPKYNTQAPVCGGNKPTSAPKITSVISAEPNTATIVWSGANDPVTYYLIAYGTKPGQIQYGNPNVGDRNTRSYQVRGLSGNQTYYFKIRAGNGCMPGPFSDEVKVTVVGPKINSSAAEGFQEGVLSGKKEVAADKLPFKPITEAKFDRIIAESVNMLVKVFDFIKSYFKS